MPFNLVVQIKLVCPLVPDYQTTMLFISIESKDTYFLQKEANGSVLC
jgi:hypothetical protein